MKAAWLPIPLALAACTQAPLDEGAAGPLPPGAVRCIDLAHVVGRRAEAPHSLVFEMAGGTVYRNQVQGSCPSLARATGTETLQFEPFAGGRICRDDGVRAYDAAEVRAGGPQSFPRCRLGVFVPAAR